MALPAFDSSVHHIGLGTSSGTLKGFYLTGNFSEYGQEAPKLTDYGGTEELVETPSLSRWTMDNFTGGAFFPTWQPSEPYGFHESKNLAISQLGTSLRTVPPLVVWDDEVGAPIKAVSSGAYLVTLESAEIVRFAVSDHTRTTYLTSSGTHYGAAVETAQLGTPVMWVANDTSSTYSFKRRSFPDFGTSYTDYDLPGSGAHTAAQFQGMELTSVVPLFCFNRQLYSAALSSTDATPPVYTALKKLPGNWKDSVVFNGLTYILCSDSNWRTWICTTDGSDLSTLAEFPYSFNGRCITSYAGRVFVGGDGVDFDSSISYAELYEVSGNSLRLVKTFAPEDRIPGAVVPKGLASMAVFEGLLWLGISGEYLIAYEFSTDSFYGVSAIPDYANVTVNHLCVAGSQLFVYGTHATTAASTGWYRTAVSGDTVSSWTGDLITGDFGPEPGLDKRWSQLHLLTRRTASSATYEPTVEYSTDGGSSFTTATVTHTTTGVFRKTVADLSPAATARTIRFRIKLPRGTTTTDYSELMGFTVAFAFLPVGKMSWQMAVHSAEYAEGVSDYQMEAQDVSGITSQLRTWFQASTQLVFKDLDNVEHNVQVVGFTRQVLPQSEKADGDVRESVFNLRLVEV